MKTVSFTAPRVEGMCQADQYADTRRHASMDLNGEWFGTWRGTRRGMRLLQATEGTFDFKAIKLFEATTSKELRALVVAHVVADAAVQLHIPYMGPLNPAANPVTFHPHEVVCLVLRVSDGAIIGWGRPFAYPDDDVNETEWSGAPQQFFRPLLEAPGPWAAHIIEHRGVFYIYGVGVTNWVMKVWRHQVGQETIDYGTIGGTVWSWDDGTVSPSTTSLPNELAYDATGLQTRFGNFAVRSCVFERGMGWTAYAYMVGAIKPVFCALQHDSLVWLFDDDYVNVSSGIDLADETLLRDTVVTTDAVNLVSGVRVDERVAWLSDPGMPLSVAWVSQYTHDTGEKIRAVASMGTRFAIIGENKTKVVSDLSQQSFVDPTLEYGTCAPWSVKSFDDRAVFVSHEGIVVLSSGGGKVVSAPFLDPLFEGTSKATTPRQKFREGRRVGLPYSVDHDRLHLAVATHDRRNTSYIVAVTTVGSLVPNDLLIIWNYGADRFHLHHGTETISEGEWYAYLNESRRDDPINNDIRLHAVVVKANDDDLKNYVRAMAQMYDAAHQEWNDIEDQPRNYPLFTSLWWRDVDTLATNRDSVTAFVNGTGVYVAWDGDEEMLACDLGLAYLIIYGYYRMYAVLFPSCIISVRSTPMIGLGDFASKNVQGVRLTLAEPIYKSDGVCAVYAETEHGSTECLSVEADAPERFRTHETTGSSSTMQTEPDRPYWGADGEEWGGHDEGGTGRKWYRPDAVSLRLDANIPDTGWVRVTVFDALGQVEAGKVGMKRELKLVNLGLEVAVDRPSEQAW